jgi:hypothetical protein
MKKLLLLLLSFLAGGVLTAQENGKPATTKSVLAFHIGLSNPLDDFRSKTFNNTEAGFANPGYTLNLSYSYLFEPNFGFGGELFYNKYKLDEGKIKEVYSDADVDHWQFYGLTAGPVFSFDLSNGISTRLRVLGGAAYCNSPKAFDEGDLVLNEEWSWSTIVKGGLDFSFETGKQFCIILNADYLYTRPGFDITPIVGEIADRTHQRISALNVTAGIGIRF